MSSKQWSCFGPCLKDHATFLSQLPNLFLAYLMYNAQDGESIMLTVNSVNKCSYCTGLHGELARLSGLSAEDTDALQNSKSLKQCIKVRDTPAVRFAYQFAESGGEIIKNLKDAKVADENKNHIIALSYFLYWGSYGGNTINSFLSGKNISFFGLLFTLYYAALYLLVVVTTYVLKILPSGVPGIVSTILGIVLVICAYTFIIPIGVIGKIAGY